MLVIRPAGSHHWRMHRRLVFDDPISRAALWSRRLAWFALLVLLLALVAFRTGEPSEARLAPVAGAYLVVLAALGLAILAFVRIWRSGHRGVGMASQAFLLCLVMLAPAAWVGFRYLSLPALTDVTTDIDQPPAFGRSRAALDARAGRVPPDPAAETRALQRRGYPRLAPIVLDVPAEAAFDLARRAAQLRGWTVIEAVRPGGRTGAGRIEAVATSRVTGLSEDVTIRIRPRADGSRIDLRSASRIGRHDLGGNAARIRSFADEVELLMESR